MSEQVDVAVIGAGVIGLAVARALAMSGREVIVLEKNGAAGEETSSRNSEVIHAGIYYPPGSLKARLCRIGKELLYEYCRERNIGHRRCGKLIVASHSDQVPALEKILAQATANGVSDLYFLETFDVRRLEPHIVARRALFSPSTGIVDSHELMVHLEGDVENHGGTLAFRSPVVALQPAADGIMVTTGGDGAMELRARLVINAAGLGAQKISAGLLGANKTPPLRYAIGHYYALTGKSPFNHLIYPVPEEGGLGIHVTLDLGGQARFGPDVRWRDKLDYAFDDSRRDDFISAIRSYYPALEKTRLQPAYTGIRPKLSGPGEPAADFRIDGPHTHGIPGLVNLFGIESPGLTAALAIADEVKRLASDSSYS